MMFVRALLLGCLVAWLLGCFLCTRARTRPYHSPFRKLGVRPVWTRDHKEVLKVEVRDPEEATTTTTTTIIDHINNM